MIGPGSPGNYRSPWPGGNHKVECRCTGFAPFLRISVGILAVGATTLNVMVASATHRGPRTPALNKCLPRRIAKPEQ